MGQAKNRGTYEERVKQAQQKTEETNMPSFIVRLHIDDLLKITYDKTGLTDKQRMFANACIGSLKKTEDIQHLIRTGAFGTIFWGNSQDFGASIIETKKDADLGKHWIEMKDMFMSKYYATTNQKIELSEAHCEAVIQGTTFQPLGIKLNAEKHKFTNFSLAVAYAWQQSKMTKTSFGDLCPPEADPTTRFYTPRFVECVTEALLNLGVRVKLDWKPGAMITEFVQEEA